MKKIIIFLFMALSLAGCKKDLEIITISATPTASAVSPLSSSTFVLVMDNAANMFQTFNWTKADYGFPASVTYILQVDKKSNNFSTPFVVTSVISALTSSITVGDFNKVLLNMGLASDAAADVQFRVKAIVNPNVDPVYSNILEAKVTPYAIVFPPIYMCGAATGGWSWNKYVYKEVRSSAPNVYKTIARFLNGETFRFFKQADWGPTSYNFPYFTGTVSNLFVNASDGDSNFRFTGTTGYYEITVNMTTKSVAMTAVDEPVLFMTGAALGGWDWSTNFVQLTWKSNGIFEATTDFVVETFRFFKQAGWGDAYNYPYFAAGTVSPLFENANDGDKNFKFIGTPGNFKITVNLLDLTVTMEPAK